MYLKSAKYYDIIFANKRYADESVFLIDLISKHSENYNSLLNLACGTGNHDSYLSKSFQVTGLDINPEFINIAKLKNPGIEYHIADMTNYAINEKYDVITCLASSIANLKNISSLRNMIKISYQHLSKNGMLIIEPFFQDSEWRDKFIGMKIFENDKYKYSIISRSTKKNNNAIAEEFHTYVSNTEIDVFKEIFEFGLFSRIEIENIFNEFNLQYQFQITNLFSLGLHIGFKKS